MSWNKSVFTTVGTGMMSEVLSGATMTITKAVGGSGTTEEASLAALTDVQEEKQTLKILGIEDAADSSGSDMGKRIKIQITNGDVEAGYILHQVGVYAKLADGDETLLLIMQDDRGVEIPSHTENSDFVIELFGVMEISNIANIKVTVDPSAVASVKMVNDHVKQINTKIDDTKKALQDEAKETYVPLSGGTLTGPLVMPGGGKAISILDNAGTHNMIYRGKNLGQQPDRRAGPLLSKLVRSRIFTSAITGRSTAWTTLWPVSTTGISAAILPAPHTMLSSSPATICTPTT